ncbi:hypothetical protein VEE68_35860 [Escherichia coli]|nr:hypothetical protein VEGS12_28990 [Escherichia coli]BDZ89139.1 hypothetical protein VEE68_35860 [Escherichia coli]
MIAALLSHTTFDVSGSFFRIYEATTERTVVINNVDMSTLIE